MIRMRTLGVVGALALLSAHADAQQGAPQQRALLDKYCVGCHNQRLKTADLMLDKADVNNVPAGAEIWEKVIRKVRGGMMPPAGMPRPDKAGYDSFATYLETALDRTAAVFTPASWNLYVTCEHKAPRGDT